MKWEKAVFAEGLWQGQSDIIFQATPGIPHQLNGLHVQRGKSPIAAMKKYSSGSIYNNIDISFEEYYISTSIPAAPLLSMRNSVGFSFYGRHYGIYQAPSYP